jgi:hypothetical protein
MTQSWLNTAPEPVTLSSAAPEVPPADMALACRTLAMSMFGMALIEFGFASNNVGEGLALLIQGPFDFGRIYGPLSISLMIAGLWLSITNWDNPHSKAVYKELPFEWKSFTIRVLAITLAIISFGVIIVALFAATWLKAEFGIPLGGSRFIVGGWFLIMGIMTVGQVGYLFGLSARYKA